MTFDWTQVSGHQRLVNDRFQWPSDLWRSASDRVMLKSDLLWKKIDLLMTMTSSDLPQPSGLVESRTDFAKWQRDPLEPRIDLARWPSDL